MNRQVAEGLAIAWGVVKCGALVVGSLFLGGSNDRLPGEKVKTKEELAREADERRQREEAHRKFFNSLTPNERVMYKDLQRVKADNQELREGLAEARRENERLSKQLNDLE